MLSNLIIRWRETLNRWCECVCVCDAEMGTMRYSGAICSSQQGFGHWTWSQAQKYVCRCALSAYDSILFITYAEKLSTIFLLLSFFTTSSQPFKMLLHCSLEIVWYVYEFLTFSFFVQCERVRACVSECIFMYSCAWHLCIFKSIFCLDILSFIMHKCPCCVFVAASNTQLSLQLHK